MKSRHHQLSLSVKIALAATSLFCLSVVGLGIYVWVQSEDFPVPPPETTRLTTARPFLVDVVLVDGAVLEKAEIDEMVRPLRMVLQRRLPGKMYHARIAVYGAGLPLSIEAEGGMAGFMHTEDSFFVDLRLLRKNKPLPGTRVQWWGLWMGHEAMHLVQKERGDRMTAGSRGDTYDTDPVEVEAATEGASVANSLGIPVSWSFAGRPLQSEDPWVYWPYIPSRIPDEIRVSVASTRRGSIVRTWQRVTALFSP